MEVRRQNGRRALQGTPLTIMVRPPSALCVRTCVRPVCVYARKCFQSVIAGKGQHRKNTQTRANCPVIAIREAEELWGANMKFTILPERPSMAERFIPAHVVNQGRGL